jgi:cytochrome c-type biogenesis protein CcmH/NrfG
MFTGARGSVTIEPSNGRALDGLLGYTYRITGDFHNAIAAYQEALRLRPNFAEAHEYLGKAYLAKGMRQETEEQYRILLQTLNPAMAAELRKLMCH